MILQQNNKKFRIVQHQRNKINIRLQLSDKKHFNKLKLSFKFDLQSFLVMIASDYTIEDTYVDPNNYALVSGQSKRRNIIYDNYLEIIEKIFLVYKQFYEETQELFKVRIHQKSIYVEEFKNFFRKFGEIVRDTSVFQIDSITEIRVNREDGISKITASILSKVQAYSKTQQSYKSKITEISKKKQQIQNQYSNLKSQLSQASAYYNKHTKSKVKSISQKIQEVAQLQKSIQTNKLSITSNGHEFQQYLIHFRKKLLQNKYNILNKMTEHSKHFRNCLTQILLLLIECVNSKAEVFFTLVKNPKDDTITISQSKGRKKGDDLDTLISNLINSIQEYDHIIDDIIFILKGLDTSLKNMRKKTDSILQTYKKQLLENLNQVYTIDETPLREVSDTLDIYEYYTNKICDISDKLYQCSQKLIMLKQNVKKHADVTLSLIRTNQKKKDDIKIPQLDQVYNQISYDFVTEILCEIYKSYKETLGDLKNHFNQKFYKKKKHKVQDSMEISHIDETMIAQKKKPCKKQLWLWRDWRDTSSISTQSECNFKQISQFLSGIKFEEQSKEIKKFEAIFYGKKDTKGILKVCQKSLQFVSIIGTGVHLCIPYTQIQSLEIKVRIFEKYIEIKTEKGELGFSKLSDILHVQNLIKQHLEKSNIGGAPKLQKKAQVQLLPEELQFIEKNRSKINEQRPSIEGMNKIKSTFIENITVDVVYEYIYSDKPFTIRGKPQNSFFAYATKKAKNFNYVHGQYDKPGPQFYSRNPEVKFTNCPLFSTRTNEFDHPIPPIPFMPKSCHCQEICSMYWLCNEYFDYHILSKSSGAPYADTFEVKILHKIYRQGNGVKIQIYGGLFFNQNFSMMGMIKSKGQNEMNEQGISTLKQIQDTLKIVTGQSTQTEKGPESTPEQQKKPSNNQVSKLKNQNKLLLLTLLVVFIINIALRFLSF